MELHGATEAHYVKLHGYMATQGMQRYVVADDGLKYWLPPLSTRL